MKHALVAILGLTAAAYAQTFPPPFMPERTVSDPAFTFAAGTQSKARVGTNGELGLAAWRDTRGGAPAIYISRLDADGNPLEPLGVRIANAPGPDNPEAVVWNGDAFVVVVGQTLIFVAPDLTITGSTSLGLGGTYAFAAAMPGPDARFLYVEAGREAGTEAVADGLGSVVSSARVWTNDASSSTGVQFAAAGNDSGFVLLRDLRDASGNRIGFIADQIDRNGRVVASRDSGLAADLDAFGPHDMAGSGDGFLVVRETQSGVTAYALDATGLYRGVKYSLSDRGGLFAPAVVAESGRFVAAWLTQSGEEWVGEVDAGGTVATHRIAQLSGTPSDIAIASTGAQRLVTVSVEGHVYAHALAPSLAAGETHLVTAAATYQDLVDIASGVNGYAVTWIEPGPGFGQRVYVRRFSPIGEPQDPAPLLVIQAPYTTSPHIISNGSTYAIGWAGLGFVFRRLDAATGHWIDSEPVTIAIQRLSTPAFASNGTDALVVAVVPCGTGPDRCLATAQVPMNGDAPSGPSIVTRVAPDSVDPTIGSNGSDYLVAWTDPPSGCLGCVGPLSWQIYVLPLRANGTLLGLGPLIIPQPLGGPYDPRIAWGGGRYLITWLETEAVHVASGVRVDVDGNVLGEPVILAQSNAALIVRPAAVGNKFALLIGRIPIEAFPTTGVLLEGVAFPADADLRTVLPLPRTLLASSEFVASFLGAAVSRNDVLAVAYTHEGVQHPGGVRRAFLRLFAAQPRKRAAR